MAKLFGIVGCEASLDSFFRTGLMEHCSLIEKRAMYLYYALKRLSRQFGHTYVKPSRLAHEALAVQGNYQAPPKAHEVVDWDQALDFLEEWGVIVRENERTHVYLHRYWNAEKKIAEAFYTLRSRHEVDPWTFQIDAEKYVCLSI